MITFGLSWGFGYFGMWAGKWGISWMLTGYNTFADAFNAATGRIAGNVRGVDTKLLFMHLLQNKVVLLVSLMLCLMITVFILVMYISIKKKKTSLAKILPLCFVSVYPFVWYSVLTNHSIEHNWMTHKLLSVSVFALGCVLIKCSGYKKPENHG